MYWPGARSWLKLPVSSVVAVVVEPPPPTPRIRIEMLPIPLPAAFLTVPLSVNPLVKSAVAF